MLTTETLKAPCAETEARYPVCHRCNPTGENYPGPQGARVEGHHKIHRVRDHFTTKHRHPPHLDL